MGKARIKYSEQEYYFIKLSEKQSSHIKLVEVKQMKMVKSKTTSGQLVWILTPDIFLTSITKRKAQLSFLDVFYAFAPQLVKSKDSE
jgi:hypothetical protein